MACQHSALCLSRWPSTCSDRAKPPWPGLPTQRRVLPFSTSAREGARCIYSTFFPWLLNTWYLPTTMIRDSFLVLQIKGFYCLFEEWIQGSNNAPVNVEMGALGARFLIHRWQHPYLKHWQMSITKSGKFNGTLINPKVSHPDPLGIGRCIWTTMLVPSNADTSGFCVVSLRRRSQVGIWGCKFKTSKDYYMAHVWTIYMTVNQFVLHCLKVKQITIYTTCMCILCGSFHTGKILSTDCQSEGSPDVSNNTKYESWVKVFDQQRNLKHDSFLQFQKVQGVICGIGDVVRGRHWSREE